MRFDPHHLESSFLGWTVSKDPLFARDRAELLDSFAAAVDRSPEELEDAFREQAADHAAGFCQNPTCQAALARRRKKSPPTVAPGPPP